MATITLKGSPVHTCGELPLVGEKAPNFQLVRSDLSWATLETYRGKKKIISVFPSIDTPVCATSVKKFNEVGSQYPNAVLLNISADLPFAQKRFCSTEGIKNVETLSILRSTFGRDWGVEIIDGPFAGCCCRAVVVLNEENRVIYTELVPEIAEEPNYEKALAAIRS